MSEKALVELSNSLTDFFFITVTKQRLFDRKNDSLIVKCSYGQFDLFSTTKCGYSNFSHMEKCIVDVIFSHLLNMSYDDY